MRKYNQKVQMMDAGMTLFVSPENFGTVIGMVRGKMEKYGHVLNPADLTDAVLPESTGGCDLFLDWSTIWRVRYISCHVESSGEIDDDVHRYAATFKEGNRSTGFRGAVMILLLLCCVAAIFSGHGFLSTVSGIGLFLMVAYLWILPSRKARSMVASLLSDLEDIH